MNEQKKAQAQAATPPASPRLPAAAVSTSTAKVVPATARAVAPVAPVSPPQPPPHPASISVPSLQGMFTDGNSLLRAVIAAEVLGPPIALREHTFWNLQPNEPSI